MVETGMKQEEEGDPVGAKILAAVAAGRDLFGIRGLCLLGVVNEMMVVLFGGVLVQQKDEAERELN